MQEKQTEKQEKKALLPVRYLPQYIQNRFFLGIELFVVAFWALIVTMPYLDMDPMRVPTGREYLSHIASNHFWTWVRECGGCALWNGSLQGGAPTLADPFTSMLHPLVAIPTLILGVPNGMKIAIVTAFIVGGMAQWWLGHVLGLGRAARVWSACLAIVGGHLAGRMELGTFGLLLSTVACSLVFPPLITVTRTGSWRASVWLGVTLALAAVAGQGYLQVGLVFAVPAILLLIPWDVERLPLLAKQLGFAALLATLLAAPLLVPFLHFMPEFSKFIDPELKVGQPLTYVLFNLVIRDVAFYTTDIFDKLPFPFLYINYIGWIPLLLALWGLRGGRTAEERRAIRYLVAVACISFAFASDKPLAWLAEMAPTPWIAKQIQGIRYYPSIAGLAIPCVLGLSAIGLDQLLGIAPFQFHLAKNTAPDRHIFSLDIRWLFVVPALAAIMQCWSFAHHWIGMREYHPRVDIVLNALRTPDLQWVSPPFGQHDYMEPAVRMGLKVANGVRAWQWKDRTLPEPLLDANPQAKPPGMSLKTIVGGIPLYVADENREYAAVAHDDESRTVCKAYGIGGYIDVECDAAQAGVLTVKENSWSGWQAWVDGSRVPLKQGRWLQVDVPSGVHTIRLRYRPWDVSFGIGLFVVGAMLGGYVWVRSKQEVT